MEEIFPYLYISIVIVLSVLSVVFLKRHGYFLRRFKHGKTEIEFERVGDKIEPVNAIHVNSNEKIVLTLENVSIRTLAEIDCRDLNIAENDLKVFIVEEAKNHPEIFRSTFSSLPLIYSKHVLLLSWNGSIAIIERILNRRKAYPLNESWSDCLALYRQALLLPYRRKEHSMLFLSSEIRRSLNHYDKLDAKINIFIGKLKEVRNEQCVEFQQVRALLDEAEMAFASDDSGKCVTCMEAFLSTAHKLIIEHAPQLKVDIERTTVNTPIGKRLNKDEKYVLIVDDNSRSLSLYEDILEAVGIDLPIVAVYDARQAMSAIVDLRLAAVFADLRMPIYDGREIAIAVRKSNPDAKIIIVSGYSTEDIGAQLGTEVFPCDYFLKKPFTTEDFQPIVDEIKEKDSSIRTGDESDKT